MKYNESMRKLVVSRMPVPNFLLDEISERDEQIEKLQKQIDAVNQVLQDGPQLGVETADDYQVWLYSVLPFLEEVGEGDKE